MDKEIAWKEFERTGTVQSYLKYKLGNFNTSNMEDIKNKKQNDKKYSDNIFN